MSAAPIKTQMPVAPGSTIESATLDNTENTRTTKRMTTRMNVEIKGSMGNIDQQGPNISASWAPLDGKHPDVFGIAEHIDLSTDQNSAINALRNASIIKATMLEHKNTFPASLGISCSCLPADEVTADGERFLMTALPASNNTHPIVLYEADATCTEGLEWQKHYPDFNANNLESHNVMEVVKQPIVFVDQKHPVIALLRNNADLLGTKIDEQPLVQGRWHTVSKQAMSYCCNILRQRVLARMPNKDLNGFMLQLHRINGECWLDVDLPHTVSMADRVQVGESVDEMLMKTHSFMGRLELVYEVTL